VYVNDAFGAAHRALLLQKALRASSRSAAARAAGLLMERELKFLGEN
jgi:3-phosphoglycerate kinase